MRMHTWMHESLFFPFLLKNAWMSAWDSFLIDFCPFSNACMSWECINECTKLHFVIFVQFFIFEWECMCKCIRLYENTCMNAWEFIFYIFEQECINECMRLYFFYRWECMYKYIRVYEMHVRMHETFECHECARDSIFFYFFFFNVDIKECLC